MGAIVSSLVSWAWGAEASKYPPLGPNPDTKDAVTGLTPRQARDVLVTWDMVRPDLKHHGIEFFIVFFNKYPGMKVYFKTFEGMSNDELRRSKKLAAHGSTVMLALSGIIDNLGDTETLEEILKTTGKNHVRRGIPKESFQKVLDSLIKYLEDNLGAAWTSEAKEGWTIALRAVNAVICAAYVDKE